MIRATTKGAWEIKEEGSTLACLEGRKTELPVWKDHEALCHHPGARGQLAVTLHTLPALQVRDCHAKIAKLGTGDLRIHLLLGRRTST